MTLYMRYTSKTNKVTYAQHQVWDAQRFVTSRVQEHKAEGGEAMRCTAAEYREHNWPKQA